MPVDTYLRANIKDAGLVRWPNATSPLTVYMAPFTWYEKEKQAMASSYENMIWEGFDFWSKATAGKVRFSRVEQMNQSQINIVWRRVNRKSLGHCEYSWDPQGRLYSAEISIGLTDGKVHAYYDNPQEVRRTILHEIGHALGLGHSNHIHDIMYPTHQIGVNQVSARDVETLKWLYTLPPGFKYQEEAQRLGLNPKEVSIDEVLEAMYPQAAGAKTRKFSEHLTPQTPIGPDIDEQHQILTDKGRFLMLTSMIEIPGDGPDPMGWPASQMMNTNSMRIIEEPPVKPNPLMPKSFVKKTPPPRPPKQP